MVTYLFVFIFLNALVQTILAKYKKSTIDVGSFCSDLPYYILLHYLFEMPISFSHLQQYITYQSL